LGRPKPISSDARLSSTPQPESNGAKKQKLDFAVEGNERRQQIHYAEHCHGKVYVGATNNVGGFGLLGS
jgi:hypothetical protein